MDIVGFILAASAVGFAGFAAVVVGTLYGIRRLIFAAKGEPYVPLLQSGRKPPYQYLDVDTNVTADSIARILRKYAATDVVGVYAKAALDALERENTKNASFNGVLDSKFTKGSISWEKFASAASGTHEAVVRNCAMLANRVQSFDYANYRAIERLYRRAPWKHDALPTPAQAEQRRLYQQQIGDMNALITSNDNLLVELDKLAAELSRLDNIDTSDSSTRMLEEIRTLIDETRYYSNKQP
jgi:hypothetical protein